MDQKGYVKTIDVGKFLKSFEIAQQGVRSILQGFADRNDKT